ncbi:MAG TPA: hypothetical protein VE757_05150 [Gaiellaceae bacterium]|nr:hypothetical protein [Gaiellaceae bacterium]
MSKALATVAVAIGLSWHTTPARVGVSATEFHLTLSRPSVKAGVVEIELQNDGQDPHDLRVLRVGGSHTFSIPLVGPGDRRTLAIHMKPGSYRLWCSVADHRQLGMQAVLRVRR